MAWLEQQGAAVENGNIGRALLDAAKKIKSGAHMEQPNAR